jgi:hypothetical protein
VQVEDSKKLCGSSTKKYSLQKIERRKMDRGVRIIASAMRKKQLNSCLSFPFAKIVWQFVFFTYNIPPPTNIKNMFDNWLNGINKKTKARICICILALCWSIWKCRNNVIFNKVGVPIFL